MIYGVSVFTLDFAGGGEDVAHRGQDPPGNLDALRLLQGPQKTESIL